MKSINLKKGTKKKGKDGLGQPPIKKSLSERNIGIFQKGYSISTIYVGNLSYNRTEFDIKKMFSQFGGVSYVRLILDTETGSSKGIAFIQMPKEEDALAAIKKLDGISDSGRKIKVSIALESASMGRQFEREDESPLKEKEEDLKIIPRKKKKIEKGLKALFNYQGR